LLVAIERSLVPIAPPAGAAVAFTRFQIAALEAACAALGRSDINSADDALASMLSRDEDPGFPS